MKRIVTNRVFYVDPDYRIVGSPPKYREDRKGTIYVLRTVRRRLDRKQALGEG